MNSKSTVNKLIRIFLLPLLLFISSSLEAGWFNPAMKWTTSTVTYSFDRVGGYSILEEAVNYTSIAIPAAWEPVISAAFDEWAAHCGLTFVEVADSGHAFNAAGAQGDIRITNHSIDGPGSKLGHGYFPPPNGTSAAGDIHFDPSENWYVGFGAPGAAQIDLFTVALHEIGHAIGLGHTTTPGAVMYPTYTTGTTNRTLSPEEITLIQGVYGENTVVPEPATMILLALCLGGLYFMSPPPTDPSRKTAGKTQKQ